MKSSVVRAVNRNRALSQRGKMIRCWVFTSFLVFLKCGSTCEGREANKKLPPCSSLLPFSPHLSGSLCYPRCISPASLFRILRYLIPILTSSLWTFVEAVLSATMPPLSSPPLLLSSQVQIFLAVWHLS